MKSRLMLVAAVMLLGAGCATVQEPLRSQLRSDDVAVRDCASWLERADTVVRDAGVADAGATRIAGYPYLRTDRFLSSFRNELTGADAKAAWVRALRLADSEARRAELQNLRPEGLQKLAVASGDEAVARAERCGDLLTQAAPADDSLSARAVVPDDYIDWLRVVGVYPLARLPFGNGVEKWHEEAHGMFSRARAEPARAAGAWRSYVPAAAKPLPRTSVAQLLARGKQHPLGLLSLSEAERDALFATYAPVFEVDTTGAWDLPGTLKWGSGPAPAFDTSKPMVYRRIAYTRYRGAVLPQLVYTMWFSERPLDHKADIYGGALDGLVWRVTLSPNGEPLVYDTMHPCGCFHMFFPTANAEAVPPPEPRDEWAFIPLTLPAMGEDARIRLRIASRTHYLVDVVAEKPAASSAAAYAMLDESLLRSLEAPDGMRRSLYGPDGLVPGTERGERMLFWPMGIASAGTMRQWGRHATAFLGRRHFDDADLLEKRFSLKF